MKAEADVIGEELSQWDRLPQEDDLASLPLYYLGERADECFMPPDVDRRVRERCDQLQRGLYHAMTRSGLRPAPRRDRGGMHCRRGGALRRPRAVRRFILSRLESDARSRPSLCDYLDAWGVPVAEAPSGARPVRWLRESLARTGLAPVSWAGIQLAAVHVLVPGFPVLGGADNGLDDDAVARLWERASVFWHRV